MSNKILCTAFPNTVTPAQKEPEGFGARGLSPFQVVRGQLTFDAEGIESPGARYHSRVAHHPSLASGITIGRGYDMKHRSADAVRQDLMASGVDSKRASMLAQGAGLSGTKAKDFLLKYKNILPEISPLEQQRLFSDVTYPWYMNDTKRLVGKWSNDAMLWDQLDSVKQELMIDLRYRGDLSRSLFARLHQSLNATGHLRLLDLISDRALFPKVPSERFKARVEHVESAAFNVFESVSITRLDSLEQAEAIWTQFLAYAASPNENYTKFLK